MSAATSRIRPTRSFVASAEGLVVGVTRMIATSPLLFITGSETAATPGNFFRRSTAWVAISFRYGLPVESIAMVSGPVNPGPKPFVSRS
jgi:hypothetical protein